MQSKAKTPEQYLASLPEDRRKILMQVRETIFANLDPKIEEIMQYGMICYAIPHSIYPDGYHCDPKIPLPYAGLASQVQYVSLYVCVYAESELGKWFAAEWKKSGLKLNMGKCCVRFKKIEEIPLDVIGKLFKRVTAEKFIEIYETSIKDSRKKSKSKLKSKPKLKKK